MNVSHHFIKRHKPVTAVAVDNIFELVFEDKAKAKVYQEFADFVLELRERDKVTDEDWLALHSIVGKLARD